MLFPISHVQIAPAYLVALGFVVGVFGGFFGVGGSFLAGPVLFGFGLPMNFVVGTDLAHIAGKSVVAARRHHKLGNIDYRLGLLMVIGTIPGVELGAQLIEYLKRTAHVDVVVGSCFVAILLATAAFMTWETTKTLRASRGERAAKRDLNYLRRLSRWIQRVGPPPYVNLPVSNIRRLSVPVLVLVSFVGGLFSGFLGGGAGYIRMPSLIYIVGVPTHVAVATDLFEIIISAGYGTISHALKGNVDILIALVMQTGAAIGAQIGAQLTEYYKGVQIRMAFIPLPIIGAALIVYGLLSGHPFQ
ncbi:MAG TPA: sulfite exporter TauE/SafE family protein [Steroidobacteraceae bacterium]|nr:sulfite exporter TauE/SafE family protein [Steroidobacteraceae bacterium]